MGIEKIKQRAPFAWEATRRRDGYNPTPGYVSLSGDPDQQLYKLTNTIPDDLHPAISTLHRGGVARAWRNRGELSAFNIVDMDFIAFEQAFFEQPIQENAVFMPAARTPGGTMIGLPVMGPKMNTFGHTSQFLEMVKVVDPDFDAQATWDLMPLGMQRVLGANGVTYDTDFKNLTSLEQFDFTLTWHMTGIWASQTYEDRAGVTSAVFNFLGGVKEDPLTAIEVGGGIAATTLATPVAGVIYDVAIGGVAEGVRAYYANNGDGTMYQLTKNENYLKTATPEDVASGVLFGITVSALGYGAIKAAGSGFRYVGRKALSAAETAIGDAVLAGASRESAELGVRIYDVEDAFMRKAITKTERDKRMLDLFGEMTDLQDLTRADMGFLAKGKGPQYLSHLHDVYNNIHARYTAAQLDLAVAIKSTTLKAKASKVTGAAVASQGKALKKLRRELEKAEATLGRQTDPTAASLAELKALQDRVALQRASLKSAKAENIRMQKTLPIEEGILPGVAAKRTARTAQLDVANAAIKDTQATIKKLKKEISEWTPKDSEAPQRIARLESELEIAQDSLRTHQTSIQKLGAPEPKGKLRRVETVGLKNLREQIKGLEESIQADAKSIKARKKNHAAFRANKKLNPLRNRITKAEKATANLKASRSTAAERHAELKKPTDELKRLETALLRTYRSVGAVTDAINVIPERAIVKPGDDLAAVIHQIAELGAKQDIIRSGNGLGDVMEWVGEAVPFLKDKLLLIQTFGTDQADAFRSAIALLNFRAQIGGLGNNLTMRGILDHRQAFRTVDAHMKRIGGRANRAIAAVKAHRHTTSFKQYESDLQEMWQHIMHETEPDSASLKEAIREIKNLMEEVRAEGVSLNWKIGDNHFPLASWNKSLIKENHLQYIEDLITVFRQTVADDKVHGPGVLKELNELNSEWKLAKYTDLTPEQEAALMVILRRRATSASTNLLGLGTLEGSELANRKAHAGFSKEVQQHQLMDQYYNKDVLQDLYDYLHDPMIYELASRAAIKDQTGKLFADNVIALEALDTHIMKEIGDLVPLEDRRAFKKGMVAVRKREEAQYRRRFSGATVGKKATDSLSQVINNSLGALSGGFWGVPAMTENIVDIMNHAGADMKRFPALMEMMFRGIPEHILKHMPIQLERHIMSHRYSMDIGQEIGGFMMENSLSWKNPLGHIRNSLQGFKGLTTAGKGEVGGDKFWSVLEAATGGMRHMATEGGFLRSITNMGKDFSIASHMDYMLTRTAKIRSYKAALDEAFPVGHQRVGQEALATQRGLARKHGIDFEYAEWWAEKNLLSDDVFEPMMELLENKEFRFKGTFASYLDFDKIHKWANEPGNARSAYRNATEELKNYLDFMANHEIATPNAWDKITAERDNWLGVLTFALTTFPRAFASRTVGRLATMPQGRAVITLGTIVSAELMLVYARRLLQGELLEDINDDFAANPTLFMTSVIARTPLLGPWGYDVLSLASYGAGEGRYNSPLQGAGISQLDRVLKAATNAGGLILNHDGTELKDSTIETGARMIPVLNNWGIRSALRLVEAMEGQDGPVRGTLDAAYLNSRAARNAQPDALAGPSQGLDMPTMVNQYWAEYNKQTGAETITIPENYKDLPDN